ncbi:MAG: hypothetical protein VYE22_39395 [Myxococcota bacterium]|nr:hypothetical protein [Myxococcota bacterium]
MTLDEAVDAALAEAGLDRELRPEIVSMLHTPRERWLPCCGGFCDPCVATLAGVVERARSLCDAGRKR